MEKNNGKIAETTRSADDIPDMDYQWQGDMDGYVSPEQLRREIAEARYQEAYETFPFVTDGTDSENENEFD